MTAATWARAGLVWSACWLVFSAYHAVTSTAFVYAAIHAGAVVLDAAVALGCLRMLLRDLRRSDTMRHRRRLAIRGFAYAVVWRDRADPSNSRHALYRPAMLGAYRALDELVSVRAAMGEPV